VARRDVVMGEGAMTIRPPSVPLRGCAVCGQVLPQTGRCPNGWCARSDRAFSVVFAVGVHYGGLRHAILRYKYRRELWWADVFARVFADHLRAHATWFVPMPAYTGLDARRSWDPVGEIVARLERLVHPLWETAADAVVKRAETPPMQGHGSAERRAIGTGPLRRALVVPTPRLVARARILVVDDVLTEGSTLREVARALRRSGAREVAGLVLARPAWRDAAPPGRA
jgi:predicted amidophosphoribosyltransferase